MRCFDFLGRIFRFRVRRLGPRGWTLDGAGRGGRSDDHRLRGNLGLRDWIVGNLVLGGSGVFVVGSR